MAMGQGQGLPQSLQTSVDGSATRTEALRQCFVWKSVTTFLVCLEILHKTNTSTFAPTFALRSAQRAASSHTLFSEQSARLLERLIPFSLPQPNADARHEIMPVIQPREQHEPGTNATRDFLPPRGFDLRIRCYFVQYFRHSPLQRTCPEKSVGPVSQTCTWDRSILVRRRGSRAFCLPDIATNLKLYSPIIHQVCAFPLCLISFLGPLTQDWRRVSDAVSLAAVT